MPKEEGKTPQSCLTEMVAALEGRFLTTMTPLLAVPDWSTYLRQHLKPGVTGIQHCTLETDDEDEVQRAPRTFWIHKRGDGTVVLHYKEYSQDEVWAPFVDPLADVKVTAPDGIELFGSPPTDPTQHPPSFLPLRAV